MTGILKNGQAANWTQAQYNDKLRGLMADYRQELKQGNIALNSHHREWATRAPKATR